MEELLAGELGGPPENLPIGLAPWASPHQGSWDLAQSPDDEAV